MLLAVVLAISRTKASARSIESTNGAKVVPQHESSTSPLLFTGITREITGSSGTNDAGALDVPTLVKPESSASSLLSELPKDLMVPQQEANPRGGVALVWTTPSGERTTYATRKPLGVQFCAEFPLKIKREPEGHAKEIGIEVGWILKSVNGIDVTAMTDIKKVNEILYREVGEKTVPVEEWNQALTEPLRIPKGVPLVWGTPNGEQTVHASRKPLGVQFRAEFPLRVKREPEGHAREIGIKVGWILKSVNGFDVTAMTDIKKVNEILYREVGEKTVPVDQWTQ